MVGVKVMIGSIYRGLPPQGELGHPIPSADDSIDLVTVVLTVF
jgi:hypothetical protein